MNLHHNHHNHPARCLDNRFAKIVKLLASAAAILAAGFLSPALNADEVLTFDDSHDYWNGSLSTGNEGDTLELRATSSGLAWVNGDITGAGALRKTGSGELYLGGYGYFTGGLTILEGIISFDGDDMPLGASGGALTLDGGKLNSDFTNIQAPLTLDPSRPVTLGANGGSLSGVIAINQTIAGSGTLTINRYNANTVITLGGLQNYTGATTVDAAGLTITGTHLNSGGLTITNGGQVNVGEPSDMNPDLQAQARLEGDIDIRRGTLNYNGHSAATGTITIGDGGSFDRPYNANAYAQFNDTSSAGDATINISADGELWFMPPTTFDSAATSGSATINNNGGIIYFHNYFDTSSAAHTTIINDAPATPDDDHPRGFIEIASTPARTFAIGHLSGSGDIYIGNNTLVIGGLDDRPMTISGGIFYGDYYGYSYGGIIGGIEKTGDSTLTLTGSSHYYGPTAVTGGRLVLAAPDAIASSASDTIARSALVTLSGNATIAIEADNALWNLTSASADTTIELAAATTTTLRNDRVEAPDPVDPDALVTLSTGNTAYDGRIIGSGALRKTGDGALILNGANTYSGPTTIAAGVLQIGDATHAAASITSDITIDANAALVGYGHIAGDITNNGELLFLAAATSGSGATITNNAALYFHNQFDSPSLTAAHTTIINDNPSGFIEINAITPDRAFAIGHLSGPGDTYIGNTTLVIGGLDDRPMTISGGILRGDHTGSGGALGGIEKTGDSTLTLSGTNTYSGPTAVTAGRLVLAAPDTIVRSALVRLSGDATLAVTADNTLQNLTSASDAATLELAAATTTTLRNARVEIPDTDNAGAPVIISTGNTAYDGRITGPGALRKIGDGALTLNGANTYSGPTTIAAGVLQIGDATHPAASITSDITIADGATLAGYGRITGSITNNGIISLGDAFEPAATPASTPTPIPYIALRAAAPGNPAAAPAAATGNYTIQGSLTNNNLLKLGRPGGTPGNTLTITGAYAGNGVIRLNTNLATGNTDHLIVRGNATGAVNLMLDTTSAANANIRDDATLDLAALPAATTATITLVDTSWQPIDYIEAGMHTFQLTVVDGGVQLLSYDRQSHAADAILATASVAGAEWHYALDNLSKRLGDLRAETAGARNPESDAPAATRGSVWMRANTYRLNADTGISRASFHEYVSSINGGVDILRPTPRGALYLGGYFDIGRADRTFDNHGDGSTSVLGLGLYATLINPDGWYLDLIAKLERNKNEFNARATDGHITSGIYTTKNEILSVEFGRRLANAGGWWVEPGAQIAVTWLGGANYTTTGATQIPVRISNAMAMQYRVQLRAGKHIDSSRWNPYVKFAAAKNDSDTASVTAWDKTYARDCDGWRAETGAGASYLIDASSQLYFDYEYAKAASYERPWSLTFGYRRVW